MAENSQQEKLFNSYSELFVQLLDCNEMMTDADLAEIAREEAEQLQETIDEVQEDIIEAILPKSDIDGRDCLLEVI